MHGGFIMFGGWLGQKNNEPQESNIIARFDESTGKWSKVVLRSFITTINLKHIPQKLKSLET